MMVPDQHSSGLSTQQGWRHPTHAKQGCGAPHHPATQQPQQPSEVLGQPVPSEGDVGGPGMRKPT